MSSISPSTGNNNGTIYVVPKLQSNFDSSVNASTCGTINSPCEGLSLGILAAKLQNASIIMANPGIYYTNSILFVDFPLSI